jgi:hypothetical protein
MTPAQVPTITEREQLDRYYRAGGLKNMASPHIHYEDAKCPHADCVRKMEWIDFKLEAHGDPEGVYKPLVRAWWEGTGFTGRCPACHGWIHFTTLGMLAISDEAAGRLPRLPENWHSVAQFA